MWEPTLSNKRYPLLSHPCPPTRRGPLLGKRTLWSVGTDRRSSAVGNTPPAGVGTPLRTSTPVPTQGNAVGVGAMAFGTTAQRATVARKAPRHRPRQPTPSTPSDAGSLRRSSASNGSGNGSRRSGGCRRSGGGGGGGDRGGGGGGDRGGGGGDDDDDDDDEDSLPSDLSCSSRRRRRADRVLNDAQMQQQLAQILQEQRQTAAGRRIAGITTTNTITTTYKNGRRPTVTRNSTNVRN